MSLPILQPMRGLLDSHSHHFATCWKIERTDGVVLLFTDHDTSIVVGADTYLPAGGVNASARQKTSGLNPQNVEFIGIIDNEALAHEDLRAGKYREAKVTETVVDARWPWAGEFSRAIYWLVSVTYTGTQWTAQVSGLTRWLQQDVGRVYTRNCPYVLGDQKCQKNLTSFTFAGAVTALGANPRKVFVASALAGHGTGYFDGGVAQFGTGDNAGVLYEIRTYTNSGQFTFFTPVPFNMQVGDNVSAVAGCDKLATTCRVKFANLVNFGGFPFIPGNDAMVQYPDAKVQ